jgi:hypothetical protein
MEIFFSFLTYKLFSAKNRFFRVFSPTACGSGGEQLSSISVHISDRSLIQASMVKEVLRREKEGLKVYPVDRSLVFGMTGTYF